LTQLICPTDPTAVVLLSTAGPSYSSEANYGLINYACNVMIFTPNPKSLAASMPNGTSNSVIIGERSASCRSMNADSHQSSYYWVHWAYVQTMANAEQAAAGFGWTTTTMPTKPPSEYPAFPVSYQGGCPGADFSYGNLTMQVQPTPDTCTSEVTQTYHSGGMQVGLGDGSVRTVSGNISVATWRTACSDPSYWGQVLGTDW